MSVITETEIKSMTKEQNYMQGYENGKNDVLDQIRTEISNDIHKCNNTDMAFGMQHTLDIIDKYRTESEVHE